MVDDFWEQLEVFHQAELVGRVGVVGGLLVLVLDHCYYSCQQAEVVLQQPLNGLVLVTPFIFLSSLLIVNRDGYHKLRTDVNMMNGEIFYKEDE